MKELILISRSTAQHKGCVHMHTDRSPDSQCPYANALAEYRSKGFHFCVMTDHEVYWNSEEQDKEDFLVLAGVERAFLPNDDYPFLLNRALQKHCHMNLIWDVTAVAWLLNDDHRFLSDCLVHSPIPEYDHHYASDCSRHLIDYVYHVNRDALFTDLFEKLAK